MSNAGKYGVFTSGMHRSDDVGWALIERETEHRIYLQRPKGGVFLPTQVANTRLIGVFETEQEVISAVHRYNGTYGNLTQKVQAAQRALTEARDRRRAAALKALSSPD